LFGFTGDLWTQGSMIDWRFLAFLTVLAVLGILIGSQLAKKMETSVLRKAFAWFVLLMGLSIFVNEIYGMLKAC